MYANALLGALSKAQVAYNLLRQDGMASLAQSAARRSHKPKVMSSSLIAGKLFDSDHSIFGQPIKVISSRCMVRWSSGLRRRIKVPILPSAWVQTPLSSIFFVEFVVQKLFFDFAVGKHWWSRWL